MTKTLTSLFKALFPWVLYSVLMSGFHLGSVYAALIAIAVTLALNLKYLKKGYLISWVILINLFLALFAGLYLSNNYIQKDPWLISSFILSISAWFSIVIGKPFTIQYARESVPREKWQHPTFIKINQAVTFVWACAFTTSFTLHFMIMQQLFPTAILVYLIYLVSLLGIIFSLYYPKHARKKAR